MVPHRQHFFEPSEGFWQDLLLMVLMKTFWQRFCKGTSKILCSTLNWQVFKRFLAKPHINGFAHNFTEMVSSGYVNGFMLNMHLLPFLGRNESWHIGLSIARGKVEWWLDRRWYFCSVGSVNDDVLIAVSKNLLRENKQKHTITSTNDVKQWNRK